MTTERAVFPPGDAREDWTILRALSAILGKPLPYDTLAEIRSAIFETHPHLALIDEVTSDGSFDLKKLARGSTRIGTQAFSPAVDDFYLSNPIARASSVMGELRAHTTLRYHVDVNRVKWNAVDTIESYRDHCRQLPGGSETIRETSAAVMSKDERKRLLHSLSVSEFFAALYVRMSAQLYLEVSSAFPPLSVDDIREHACVNAVCNGRLRRQSTP